METKNFRKLLKITSPIFSKIPPKTRLILAKLIKREWIRTLLDPNSMRNYVNLTKKTSIKKVTLNSGTEMFVDLNDIMGYRTALSGKWDDTALKVVELFPPDNTLYIDIGANIGLTCIPIAKLGYETIAFEPNPIALSLLTKNIALNSPAKFYLLPFAVGPDSENITNVKIYVPKGNIGASSIESNWSPGADKLIVFNVPIVSLQAALKFLHPQKSLESYRNLVIKLDIEGHEDAAMKDSELFIAKTRPIVIFENNPNVENRGARFWSAWSNYKFIAIKQNRMEAFDEKRRYENVIAVPLEKSEYLFEKLNQALFEPF
jgi:FkbM family methyltransferase